MRAASAIPENLRYSTPAARRLARTLVGCLARILKGMSTLVRPGATSVSLARPVLRS
jgi:hypothetical protein